MSWPRFGLAKMRIALWSSLLLVIGLLEVCAQDLAPARIVGRVTNSSGEPLVGAKVFWNRAEGYIDTDKPSDTRTDAGGRYELVIGFTKNEPVTIREVFADLDGYVRGESTGDVPLRGGDKAALDFRLEKGEVLGGAFKLPDPATRMFLIQGSNLKTRTINARLRFTDADGNFKTYLPPGEYTLELTYGFERPKWGGLKTGREDLSLEIPPFEWTEAEVGRVFDDLWTAMDRSYSYFVLKKDVDWQAIKEKYRARAAQSKNAAELTTVLKEMLASLRDLHIWIETPTGTVGAYQSSGAYNGNPQVIREQIKDQVECGRFAVVGRTMDGFGYFWMTRQSAANEADVKKAIDAIQNLRDVPGFIVDLRAANGGNETLAQQIASVFCAKDVVYAKHKYRAGPKHDEFGPIQSRTLPAAREPYTKPVVCLIGPGAVSSGEGFVKMMKALPQVTTVGLPTRGASGNPRPFPLSRTGLTVYFSRWVDLMPDGKTFEGVGIPPDVEVNAQPQVYKAADPTLEKGFEVLREKIAKKNGAP